MAVSKHNLRPSKRQEHRIPDLRKALAVVRHYPLKETYTMKKIAVIFTLVIIILSCSKDNGSNDSWSFNWTHENVPHSATAADAYVSQAGLGLGPNQILAFISSSSLNFRVSIRLSSLTPNSYPVSLTSNRFDYVDDSGNDLAGAQGSVTISSNSNNKLSGSFSVKLINPSSDTTAITGSFTNINLHP